MFTIGLIATLLLGTSGAFANAGSESPAFISGDAISAEQLANRLVSQHDALTAASMVYVTVSHSRIGEPEGAYWRRAISASSTGMFRSDNSHGHRLMPSSFDPKRKTLVITPAESTLLEHLNRCVTTFPYEYTDQAPPVLLDEENIFDVLCWWPFTGWPPPRLYGHAYSMRTLLHEGTYRLLAEKEYVGSRQCYVLIVNDILTVWCDCERPECVLRSVRYNPKLGAIDTRFEMMEYKQCGDGIWLPTKFRIVRLDSHAHTVQLRERIIYDSTFLVSDLKINEDVLMSDFRQDYAPGTVREVRSLEGIRYEPLVEGQLDHFKSIVKWCHFGSSRIGVNQRGRWDRRPVTLILSFLSGCGMSVAISRIQRRFHYA